MSFTQELYSWLSPSKVEINAPLNAGSQAPQSEQIAFPRKDGKPVIVTFLRHCGCPFAEKNFIFLRESAHTRSDVHYIAVSHSDKAATDRWAEAVGGAGNVEVVVDHERKLYGQYGLGVASLWHVLNPWSMSNVFKLASEEKIKNRPTESGSRWQTSGSFTIGPNGEVKDVQVAQQASDIVDLEKALKSLKSSNNP